MTIKYANELMLTSLARRLKAEHASMDAYMTDGNLEGAHLRAKTMKKTLEGIMCRLDDIKDGRV